MKRIAKQEKKFKKLKESIKEFKKNLEIEKQKYINCPPLYLPIRNSFIQDMQKEKASVQLRSQHE